MVRSLDNQRLYREVTLALRTGLRDACGEFSFVRVRGLRSILKFLRSVAEADSTINLFCYSQSIPDLQVVPVLFEHSLKEPEDQIISNLDHIFTVKRMKISSPSTDPEVAVALRVLEGCCLLHPDSTILAHQHRGIQIYIFRGRETRMKFGKRLRNEIADALSEWEGEFIAYKDLKKQLKLSLNQTSTTEDTCFMELLDCNVLKVGGFFLEKEEDYIIRLKELKDILANLDYDGDLIQVKRDLVEFHRELVLLLQYTVLNFQVCNKFRLVVLDG